MPPIGIPPPMPPTPIAGDFIPPIGPMPMPAGLGIGIDLLAEIGGGVGSPPPMSFMSHGLINLAAPPLLMGIAAGEGEADMDAIDAIDLAGAGAAAGDAATFGFVSSEKVAAEVMAATPVAGAAVVLVVPLGVLWPLPLVGVITADEKSPNPPPIGPPDDGVSTGVGAAANEPNASPLPLAAVVMAGERAGAGADQSVTSKAVAVVSDEPKLVHSDGGGAAAATGAGAGAESKLVQPEEAVWAGAEEKSPKPLAVAAGAGEGAALKLVHPFDAGAGEGAEAKAPKPLEGGVGAERSPRRSPLVVGGSGAVRWLWMRGAAGELDAEVRGETGDADVETVVGVELGWPFAS